MPRATISDGRTAALVRDDGALDWLCWPRFDSPAVFAAYLDPARGGAFRIWVKGATSTQRYVDGTNVVVTTFETPSGVLELTDAMVDGEAPCVLRSARCRSGDVRVQVTFDPRFDFAATDTRLEPGATGIRALAGVFVLNVDSNVTFQADGTATFGLQRDEQRSFWLHSIIPTDAPPDGTALDRRAEQVLRATANGWRTWSSGMKYSGRYAAEVQRAALTLKLLHHRHGGFVASPVTSTDRDDRFVYLAEAAKSANALAKLGFDGVLKSFLSFVDAVLIEHPDLPAVVTLDARAAPEASSITHLDGDAKVGVSNGENAARWVVEAIAMSVRLGHGLMTERWNRIARILDAVAAAKVGEFSDVPSECALLARGVTLASNRGDERHREWDRARAERSAVIDARAEGFERPRDESAARGSAGPEPHAGADRFVLARQLARDGQVDQALALFEQSVVAAGATDPAASTLVALIETALDIDRALDADASTRV